MKKSIQITLVLLTAAILTSCGDFLTKMEVYGRGFSNWEFDSVYINLVSENVIIEKSYSDIFRVVIKSTTTDDRVYPLVVLYNKELRVVEQSGNIPLFSSYGSDVVLYVPDSFAKKRYTIRTVSGSINIDSLKPESFTINSTSGNVDLSLNALFDSLSSVTTVSGSIRAFVPSGFTHYYETTSGRMYNEIAAVTRYGRSSGYYNCGGTKPFYTNTVSGNISVMQRW